MCYEVDGASDFAPPAMVPGELQVLDGPLWILGAAFCASANDVALRQGQKRRYALNDGLMGNNLNLCMIRQMESLITHCGSGMVVAA